MQISCVINLTFELFNSPIKLLHCLQSLSRIIVSNSYAGVKGFDPVKELALSALFCLVFSRVLCLATGQVYVCRILPVIYKSE